MCVAHLALVRGVHMAGPSVNGTTPSSLQHGGSRSQIGEHGPLSIPLTRYREVDLWLVTQSVRRTPAPYASSRLNATMMSPYCMDFSRHPVTPPPRCSLSSTSPVARFHPISLHSHLYRSSQTSRTAVESRSTSDGASASSLVPRTSEQPGARRLLAHT